MKKKIFKASIFMIILLILLYATSYIFMPKSNTQEAGMHKYEANSIVAEKENTIDVLILGDSEPYTSIIPMQIWNEYGFTSYDCCSLQQSIPESFVFLKKALKKQKPKIVIVEASNIYTGSKREEHIERLVGDMLPVFEYHNRWKTIKKDELVKKVEYNVVNDLKGYHFTKEIREGTIRNIMEPTDEKNIIPRSNKLYLKLLKHYCDKNNIKLLIVRTPTNYSWNYKSYNGIKEFSENEHIDYLELNLLNNEIGIDWKNDSKDGGDHLNYYGAVKTTRYLGKYLSNMGLLKDHRKDKEFDYWHESYKNYKKIVDEN